MSSKNIEIVRRLFDAVENRDLAGILDIYDPDILIREATFLPYGGIYRGHEGATRHAFGFAQAWGEFQSEAERQMDVTFLDAGDRIVVLFRLKGLDNVHARSINVPVVGVYLLQDGKVTESQMFYSDTAEIGGFIR